MFQPQDSSSRGFTLIEVIVAAAILGVGLIPAFLQANSALTLSDTVKNSLTASYLAQEGVEVMRALRDENWFATQPFDQGFEVCNAGCQVQWNSTWESDAPQQLGDIPLKLDAAGLYQYATGTDTTFRRTVTTTKLSAYEEKVVVTVTWRDRAGDKRFDVEDHLYDWLK